MSMLLIVEELGRTLRQEIARKFATHPRASLGVALVAGLVAVVVAWSALSALFWPLKRNAYGSVSGTVTSVSGSPVADSVVLLKKAYQHVKQLGLQLGNVDCTIVAQAPKLAPHRSDIRSSIAKALGVPESHVNVKAKTAEKMGPVGEGLSMEARAVVLIHKP